MIFQVYAVFSNVKFEKMKRIFEFFGKIVFNKDR